MTAWGKTFAARRESILIIANNNILLCTSLAELLCKEDPGRHIDIMNVEDNRFLSNHYNHDYGLVVFFAIYPISKLFSTLNHLNEKNPKILLVLNSGDKFVMNHIKNLGVDGVISIDASCNEFKTAINIVLIKGLKYISPLLVSSLSQISSHNGPFSYLSRKELDVALFLMAGKRNFEIASELNISQKTVNTYKSRIYKKLEIESDIQLLRFAFKNGVFHDNGFMSDNYIEA